MVSHVLPERYFSIPYKDASVSVTSLSLLSGLAETHTLTYPYIIPRQLFTFLHCWWKVKPSSAWTAPNRFALALNDETRMNRSHHLLLRWLWSFFLFACWIEFEFEVVHLNKSQHASFSYENYWKYFRARRSAGMSINFPFLQTLSISKSIVSCHFRCFSANVCLMFRAFQKSLQSRAEPFRTRSKSVTNLADFRCSAPFFVNLLINNYV